LAEYNFKVVYRPGNKNSKADILLRHWDNASLNRSGAPHLSYFRPGELVMDASVVSSTRLVHLNSTFEEGIIRVAQADKDWEATRTAVTT